MLTLHKICAPEDLPHRIETLSRPLVMTNGCFDLLHIGHVTYLEEAKRLGASLVVALNTDASIRRLNKGVDRPINPLEDRLMLIAALSAVDMVTWFDEDTPIERIYDIRPDVLVKGGDWDIDAIVGREAVESWGGSVHAIPFRYQRSTTDLLRKIRQNENGSPL